MTPSSGDFVVLHCICIENPVLVKRLFAIFHPRRMSLFDHLYSWQRRKRERYTYPLSLSASRGSDFALKIKSQMLIICFFMADFLRESCYYESVARGVGKSPSFISCEILEGKKKKPF